MFQSFFPHLMTALGLSVETAFGMCCSNGNRIVCGQATLDLFTSALKSWF
uniref:Uncharacterized protein n=1 Tax=Rhizophora mucronata TaxID=61149 RepID=A0A2P2MRG3_RHIMU